jgi:hypothetical protein
MLSDIPGDEDHESLREEQAEKGVRANEASN